MALVGGAMWSVPAPIASMGSAALATVQKTLGMAGELTKRTKDIMQEYPWQCVLAIIITLALCAGACIAWAWRRATGRAGVRGSYTQVAPEPAATPTTTTTSSAGRCATREARVHWLLAGLAAMTAAISVAYTVRDASAAWSRSPLPRCPSAGDWQSWLSAGAWRAIVGGLVAAGSLWGCYAAIKRAPKAQDEPRAYPDIEARIAAVREFRMDWASRTADRFSAFKAAASDRRAALLSKPWVMIIFCGAGRVSFLLDYSSDVKVTRELTPARFGWSPVSIAFMISVLLILLPYFTMLMVLGPGRFTDVLEAMAGDIGETVSSTLAKVVGDTPASRAVGATIAGLHPSRDSVWARVIYIMFGLPILFFIDVCLHIVYFFKEPRNARIFNYMKLRGMCEVAENVGQLVLQICIFAGQVHPCGRFPWWQREIVSKSTLLIGIPSSMWSLKEQYAFVTKFSALQARGSAWRFLRLMANLGEGLAPASLLWALEKTAEVDLSDYDLSRIDHHGFASICLAVRGSTCLRALTISGSVMCKVARTSRTGFVRLAIEDALLGKLRRLVIVVGSDPSELQFVGSFLAGIEGHPTLEAMMLKDSNGMRKIPNSASDEADRLKQALWRGQLIQPEDLTGRADLGALIEIAARGGHVPVLRQVLLPVMSTPSTRAFIDVGLLAGAGAGHAHAVQLLVRAGANIDVVDPRTGKFPLVCAAEKGHAEVVRTLLDNGAEVNMLDPQDGFFPLLLAAQNGHKEIVRVLLDEGAAANINTPAQSNGAFPLLVAAQQGHTEVVRALLDKGAEVNMLNPQSGFFPLLMAAQNGHHEVVRVLLDEGAGVNMAAQSNGRFPLQQAAQNGHAEVVRTLLDKGAEVNKVDPQRGFFPLLQTARNGHAEVVRALLDKGAEVNMVDPQDGFFPLLVAAEKGHQEIVRVLLDEGAGANINTAAQSNGCFPLLVAAMNGHAEVVRALLNKGAEVNMADPRNGFFPLLVAAEKGHQEIVRVLLDEGAGANINTPAQSNGAFPLLVAAQQGHAEVVRALLDKGAEVKMVDPQDGFSPLLLAAQQGHQEIVRVLLDEGAGANIDTPAQSNGWFPLLQAARNGHAEVVRALLNKGAEVNMANPQNGFFPLLLAAESGHKGVVHVLLDEGAEANINTAAQSNGCFPLLQAAQEGHAEVVRALLDNGAEVNMLDPQDGWFPLLQAAKNGHQEIVRVLLDEGAGASINTAAQSNGAFPLLLAAQSGHAEVVRALLDRGAEVNMANPQRGSFPLLLAVLRGHEAIVPMLLDRGAEANMAQEGSGWFPLLIAAQEGRSAMARRLLERNADVNMASSNQATATTCCRGHALARLESPSSTFTCDICFKRVPQGAPMMSCRTCKYDKCGECLAQEQRGDVVPTNGCFPLLLATQRGHVEVVDLLMAARAEVSRAHAPTGLTPLGLAQARGHDEVAQKLLLSQGAVPGESPGLTVPCSAVSGQPTADRL